MPYFSLYNAIKKTKLKGGGNLVQFKGTNPWQKCFIWYIKSNPNNDCNS